MSIPQQIEAILFAAARPLSIKRLAELSAVYVDDAEKALVELEARLVDSGIMLQRAGNEVQLVTRPEHAEAVKQVLKDEIHGELSRPSLEALTILAYRGPLTRPELEQIRGVQSSMILRNLMLRGLIEEKEDVRLGQPLYNVSFDFLRHLGLSSVEELPKFEELRGHQNVTDVLKDLEQDSQDDRDSQDSNVSDQITV
ncbi:MAG: SMC-Scp complex subunit ScpB [Patescibacteria group bacterium]